MTKLLRTFPPSSWGDEVRVSCHVVRSGVRCFRYMQGFNNNNCGSRALVWHMHEDFPTVIDKVRSSDRDMATRSR